jgi:hypothetical protein
MVATHTVKAHPPGELRAGHPHGTGSGDVKQFRSADRIYDLPKRRLSIIAEQKVGVDRVAETDP